MRLDRAVESGRLVEADDLGRGRGECITLIRGKKIADDSVAGLVPLLLILSFCLFVCLFARPFPSSVYRPPVLLMSGLVLMGFFACSQLHWCTSAYDCDCAEF